MNCNIVFRAQTRMRIWGREYIFPDKISYTEPALGHFLARKCWLWVRDRFQNPYRDFDTSRDLYYREGKQEPSLLIMKRAQSTGAKTENLA